MTQYFYLAAPRKLPIGSFGSSPVSAQQPHLFQTELDFTHLFFFLKSTSFSSKGKFCNGKERETVDCLPRGFS